MAIAFISGYTISKGSAPKRPSNIRGYTAESGKLRFIDRGTTSQWNFRLVFSALTETEMNTLTDWLETNETEEIDMPFLSRTYRGHIMPTSIDVRNFENSTHLWDVSFDFQGVRL